MLSVDCMYMFVAGRHIVKDSILSPDRSSLNWVAIGSSFVSFVKT